jgi:hypothetical protein
LVGDELPSLSRIKRNRGAEGACTRDGDPEVAVTKPDDPLYVAMDTEIREMTDPWRGGIPCDTWQSRISTTLLYLEADGDLPFVNTEHQLPAPVGVPFDPAPIETLQ